jgi:hypothetical protein
VLIASQDDPGEEEMGQVTDDEPTKKKRKGKKGGMKPGQVCVQRTTCACIM